MIAKKMKEVYESEKRGKRKTVEGKWILKKEKKVQERKKNRDQGKTTEEKGIGKWIVEKIGKKIQEYEKKETK